MNITSPFPFLFTLVFPSLIAGTCFIRQIQLSGIYRKCVSTAWHHVIYTNSLDIFQTGQKLSSTLALKVAFSFCKTCFECLCHARVPREHFNSFHPVISSWYSLQFSLQESHLSECNDYTLRASTYLFFCLLNTAVRPLCFMQTQMHKAKRVFSIGFVCFLSLFHCKFRI